MARRRMIDPNFWTSEDVSNLTIRQRLLLIGLFSNADDHGKGKGKVAAIRSAIFTYDDIPLSEIEIDLREISKLISIVFYEVSGNSYYKFNNWSKWQRVDKPQISLIPDPDNDSCVNSKNDSENGSENEDFEHEEPLEESFSPKGKERKGIQNNHIVDSNECDDAFETWYSIYPKQGSVRKKAHESWNSLWKAKKIDLEKLMTGTHSYIAYQNHNNYKTCGAQVFLNQQRWEDNWTIQEPLRLVTDSSVRQFYPKAVGQAISNYEETQDILSEMDRLKEVKRQRLAAAQKGDNP